MKFRKQVMAVITVFTVLASLLPTGITVSAESNNCLFIEDFEDYEVGTIVEATENQDPAIRYGHIQYKLVAGDKLAIRQEANGNKYLEISRTDTSTTKSYIKYFFAETDETPVTFAGAKYAVSYNFMPETHNQKFTRFGCLWGADACQPIVSYGRDVYVNGDTSNSNYRVANLLKTANYWSSYATITQTIDLTKTSDNYTFTATYKNDSGYNTTVNVARDITDPALLTGLTGVAWDFQKHSTPAYNGPDSRPTAVYRIDNIRVDVIPTLVLSSTSVANNGMIRCNDPFTMTFSAPVSEAPVTLNQNGVAMDSSEYTVNVSGQTVSVIPIDGWEDGSQYTVVVGSVTSSGFDPYPGGTFTLTGSNYLFTENFESYNVGTLAEATTEPVTRQIGNIYCELRIGDKIEIAQDGNGNKYLKITRTDTSTDRLAVKYKFPNDTTYSNNKYSVSYDIKPDVHSRYFAQFGSLLKDDNGVQGSVNCATVSYGNNVYANGIQDGGDLYYIGGILDSSRYTTDSSYATVTQTVDFTKASNNYQFTAVYPNDSGGTTTTTKTNTATGTGFFGLFWSIIKNSSAAANGTDTGAAVYRIDNIIVKDFELDLISTNVADNGIIKYNNPFTMTFSDPVSEASVTLNKNGRAMDSDDYTVTVSGQDVSVIPTDGWENGSLYAVVVGSVTSLGCSPYEGTTFVLTGNNDLFLEDFEDYEIGVIATGPVNTVSTTIDPSGLVYKLEEGDTLEVVEKDGSKVLKLTTAQGNTTGRRLLLDFDQNYGGSSAYDVSFDYYVQNNSVWFSDFGTIADDQISNHPEYVHSDYYAAIEPISSYSNSLYLNRGKMFYGANLLSSSDAFWKHQNTMIDFSEDPASFIIGTTKVSNGTKLAEEALTVSETFGEQTADNISSIAWGFTTNASQAWNVQDEGSGVYYIDNIRVRNAKLALVNSNIGSGEKISAGTDIRLEFNGAILDDAADYITVKKNGTSLSDSEYSVSLSQDNKTIIVSPVNGWKYNSTYVVEIGNIENPAFETFKGALMKFNIGAKAGGIYVSDMALNATEDNVYGLTATVNNDTNDVQTYQLIVSLKNKSDGRLVDLRFAGSGSLAAKDSEEILIPGADVNLYDVDYGLILWKNFEALKNATAPNVTDIKIGNTVIFANNSHVVLVDGEPVEESVGVTKNSNGFVIPKALALKYFDVNSDLTEEDIAESGIGVYVSDDYDFIAIGEDIQFDAQSEEDTIMDFGIYVSPDGSDSNKGYCSEPVKTLTKAVKLYKDGNKRPIMLHGGIYRLSQALLLNSGQGYDGIAIKDVGDGEVILSGSVELPRSEFTNVLDGTALSKIPYDARPYVKQISLADYVPGDMSPHSQYTAQLTSDAYYELFSGDSAQTLARWPNKEDGFAIITQALPDNDPNAKKFFRFNNTADNIAKTNLWKSSGTGMIAGYLGKNYSFEYKNIDPANSGNGEIMLKKDAKYEIKTGQRFYAMNMLEELDEAGEYYIDTTNKILYYYPTTSFTSVNPELSIMDKTYIRTDGDEPYYKNCLMYFYGVSNVKISGITFEKTRGSGIVTEGGSNISIDGCTFRNIGNTAVELHTTNSEVKNSLVYEIGGPGIVAEAGNNVKLTHGGIVIEDNEFHDFGRVFRTYQPAINLKGCGNIAQYNTIHDAPHCAVRFTGSEHLIQNNKIYDVTKETTDSGAIYCGRDWTAWGTRIKNNYIFNVTSRVNDNTFTNQAIYLDDLMSGTIVEGNIIKDCGRAALIGGGRANTFQNNTVIDCNKGLQYDDRGENWASTHAQAGNDPDNPTVFDNFVTFYTALGTFITNNGTTWEQAKAVRDAYNGDQQGFTMLVADYENNLTGASLALPKDAIIKNNSFYGSHVNDNKYLDIFAHVTSYGTISGTSTATSGAPSVNVSNYGKRN